ncbi:MAG: STAS domain-containing protein [Thermoleophilia bacterium]|nr:STAS domain-containing protein [Thermoleophilia bacterium]
MALEMETRTDGDLTIVGLTGELDIYTVADFRHVLDEVDPGRGTVVFDLTHVTLLDSSGLGALVHALNQSRRSGGRIGIVCPEARLARVFSITGLDDAFVFGDDLDHLRAALAAPPAIPPDRRL